MTATAAAAIGSSFSPSIQTLKCMRFKQLTADHSVLRIPSARAISSISNSYFTHELFPTSGSTVQKWPLLKVSAAVAQQEAAATAQVEESLVEEEEKEGKLAAEGEAQAQAETEAEPPVNTKLYFGNLPYNVDSAQLAGIIQEYGSPELVEVHEM